MENAYRHYTNDTLRVLGIITLALAATALALGVLSVILASDPGWLQWTGAVAAPVTVGVLGWLTLQAGRRGAGRDSSGTVRESTDPGHA